MHLLLQNTPMSTQTDAKVVDLDAMISISAKTTITDTVAASWMPTLKKRYIKDRSVDVLYVLANVAADVDITADVMELHVFDIKEDGNALQKLFIASNLVKHQRCVNDIVTMIYNYVESLLDLELDESLLREALWTVHHIMEIDRHGNQMNGRAKGFISSRIPWLLRTV